MNLYKQVDNKVELCILPKMEEEVNKLFEHEIKKGYREEMPDGRIFFAFEITPEKASLLHWVSRWVENESGKKDDFILGEQRNAS